MTEGRGMRQEFFGPRHRTIVRPSRGFRSLNLKELFAYRELIWLLARRDISIRYRQSIVGVGWAIFQPLVTMVVFTVIFGRFARLPSDGVPYPIFTLCALLPWNYFARALSTSSDSLVASAALITKVYFPRLVLPLSKVLSGLVDLAIAFIILLIMMVWYKVVPTIGILALPLFILIAVGAALGIGLWLTALNVRYRDVGVLVPFLAQVWFYASPVAYASSLVPERWQRLYGLNPMVGVIEGFRWALLGTSAPRGDVMLISACAVAVLLLSGVIYFKQMESTFADII